MVGRDGESGQVGLPLPLPLIVIVVNPVAEWSAPFWPLIPSDMAIAVDVGFNSC